MLKEKVYLNRITIDYQTFYNNTKDYFNRHRVEISFDFVQSDYKQLSYKIVSFPQGMRTILQPTMSNVVPIDTTYDLTSFVFNGEEFTPPNIPTGYTYCPIKQPFLDILLDARTPEANYLCIIHEHMHALVYKANLAGFPTKDVMDIDSLGRSYYNNNLPEQVDSNFGEQWILLQPYIKSLTKTNMYKYFQSNEIVGLKPEFVTLLDQARGIAGIPFIITSGYRDPAHNAAVGGVMDSAHETGLAVDLLIKDGISGEKINSALHKVGLNRFGYYQDGHLHVDYDLTKPNPCYWVK